MTWKVIIIEDDDDLRESLIDCLDMAGFKASGASCAGDFHRLDTISDYAAAVVDIGLPDQSGYELAEHIRKNTSMGVLILTARDGLDDRVKGYESGADQYFVKPIRCRELAAAVTSLVKRRTEETGPGDTPAENAGPDAWVLNVESAILTTPEGDAVRLTGKESHFVSLLLERPDRSAPRPLLLKELEYQPDEYGHRALNSLVLRLRKKIEAETDRQSPIKTAHTVGFYFAEPAVVEGG